MSINRTTYRTNSHLLPNIWLLIYIAFSAGFAGMFIGIMLTGNVIISMGGLFIPMLFVFGFFSGKTEYTLDEKGLYKHIRPYLFSKSRETTIFYQWNQVYSFKEGKDMTRQLREYQYLEIYFGNFTNWQITDGTDKTAFEVFKSVFLYAVEMYNHPQAQNVTPFISAASAAPHTPTKPVATETAITVLPSAEKVLPPFHIIGQKKTIYQTIWGKVFFVILLFFVLGISYFLILHPQYIGVPVGFRLLFVMVPGLAYVGWRVWGKKK